MRTVLKLFGIAALAALFCARPAHAAPEHYSDKLFCLAHVVYAEARNQPRGAQRDVAFSVLNRAKLNRKDFGGNTVCGVACAVVTRPDKVRVRQYTGVECSPSWRPKDWDAWFDSLTVAYEALSGKVEPKGVMREALYYLAPKDSMSGGRGWIERNLKPLVWSGAHRFYGEYPKTKTAAR